MEIKKSNQFPFIDWYDASNIPTDNNEFRIYTTWEKNEESNYIAESSEKLWTGKLNH